MFICTYMCVYIYIYIYIYISELVWSIRSWASSGWSARTASPREFAKGGFSKGGSSDLCAILSLLSSLLLSCLLLLLSLLLLLNPPFVNSRSPAGLPLTSLAKQYCTISLYVLLFTTLAARFGHEALRCVKWSLQLRTFWSMSARPRNLLCAVTSTLK